MRVYTVHLRHLGLDPDRDIVLVKEGFSWPAFVLTFLWALWHRLWWAAAALFAAGVIGGLLDATAPDIGIDAYWGGIGTVLVSVMAGLFGNDALRWGLARRGFETRAVVAARDRDAALHRFLERDPDFGGVVAR